MERSGAFAADQQLRFARGVDEVEQLVRRRFDRRYRRDFIDPYGTARSERRNGSTDLAAPVHASISQMSGT
jgi:hypothetical protein